MALRITVRSYSTSSVAEDLVFLWQRSRHSVRADGLQNDQTVVIEELPIWMGGSSAAHGTKSVTQRVLSFSYGV
jgi:hypothetical protein